MSLKIIAKQMLVPITQRQVTVYMLSEYEWTTEIDKALALPLWDCQEIHQDHRNWNSWLIDVPPSHPDYKSV